MQAIIILITIISLITLCAGFFEIKLPFISVPVFTPRNKITRHAKKILHKRIWFNHLHKGFIKLPVNL